jgi:hypothetical protein
MDEICWIGCNSLKNTNCFRGESRRDGVPAETRTRNLLLRSY